MTKLRSLLEQNLEDELYNKLASNASKFRKQQATIIKNFFRSKGVKDSREQDEVMGEVYEISDDMETLMDYFLGGYA
nr:hypothetical protein 18 [Legionellales bacterium]